MDELRRLFALVVQLRRQADSERDAERWQFIFEDIKQCHLKILTRLADLDNCERPESRLD